YRNVGILNFKSMEESGEKNILNNVLKPFFKSINLNPIIFDVGANTGGYYKVAKLTFPKSRIYSFEPNPISFEELLKNNPDSLNIALGNQQSEITMYRPMADLTSEHFTSNKEFLSTSSDVIEIKVKQFTLSDIVKKHSIERIDFLKIDTEGHDLQVLQGA